MLFNNVFLIVFGGIFVWGEIYKCTCRIADIHEVDICSRYMTLHTSYKSVLLLSD